MLQTQQDRFHKLTRETKVRWAREDVKVKKLIFSQIEEAQRQKKEKEKKKKLEEERRKQMEEQRLKDEEVCSIKSTLQGSLVSQQERQRKEEARKRSEAFKKMREDKKKAEEEAKQKEELLKVHGVYII